MKSRCEVEMKQNDQLTEKSSYDTKTDNSLPRKKKTQKMFSIKWRFGMVYSLLLSISFLCLFLVVNWIFVGQSTVELENRALTVAKSVVASGTTPILGKKLDVFNKLVRDLAQLDPDVAYIITSFQGKQLLLHNLSEGLPEALSKSAAPGTGTEPRFTYYDTGQRGIREAAVSLLGDNGVVRVGISDLRIKGNIRRNQLVLIAVMLTSMLLGTVVSILFSRRLTKPLIHLAEAADQICSGNMDVYILKAKHNDEIKILADAFERMRESFSIAMRRMRAKR